MFHKHHDWFHFMACVASGTIAHAHEDIDQCFTCPRSGGRPPPRRSPRLSQTTLVGFDEPKRVIDRRLELGVFADCVVRQRQRQSWARRRGFNRERGAVEAEDDAGCETVVPSTSSVSSMAITPPHERAPTSAAPVVTCRVCARSSPSDAVCSSMRTTRPDGTACSGIVVGCPCGASSSPSRRCVSRLRMRSDVTPPQLPRRSSTSAAVVGRHSARNWRVKSAYPLSSMSDTCTYATGQPLPLLLLLLRDPS